MMRKIAIGLAVATVAMGGSTLTASALHGQQSGISKSSMSQRLGPRTYGYEEERGRGGYEPMGRYERDRYGRTAGYESSERISPLEREHLRSFIRESYGRLTPREREHLHRFVREGFERLTPREREHLRRFVREGYERLTPREREHLRTLARERYGYRYDRSERAAGYVPDRFDGVSRYNRGGRYYDRGERYERLGRYGERYYERRRHAPGYYGRQ